MKEQRRVDHKQVVRECSKGKRTHAQTRTWRTKKKQASNCGSFFYIEPKDIYEVFEELIFVQMLLTN